MSGETSGSDDCRTICDAFAGALVAEGVTTAFGLMGEDGAALVTCLVEDHGVRYIGTRHENIAVNMADGYARAFDGPGVCIISLGPGITNAMTALTTIARGRHAVVIVAGDEAPGGPKRIDQVALAAAAGLELVRATDSADALAKLRQAFAHAREGRPALLTFAPQILGMPAPEAPAPPTCPVPSETRPAPSESDIRFVTDLVAERRRPLILAGRGALGEGVADLLARLSDRIGAVLGTTLLAKDLFRGNPYSLGIVGGFASGEAREVLAEVDCVLAFGASLNVFTTAFNGLFHDAPVVQFDIDAGAIGASFDVARGVVSDVRRGAESLLDALPTADPGGCPFRTPEVITLLAEPAQAVEADPESSDGPALDPRRLMRALDEMLPRRRTVITDAGHTFGFAAMAVHVDEPGHYFPTMQFAAIGMGVGTALGVAVGEPTAQAVLFVGDGALAMTLGDLETAARHEIPLIIVVLNDQAYGAERHFLDLEGISNDLARFPDIEFAAVGSALGIESATVHSLDDLDDLDIATPRTRPLLLDCKIDPEVRSEWLEEIAAANAGRYR